MPDRLKTPERKNNVLLNVVIGVSIALVGVGLIWAAFNCIDSLQHNSEVIRHYKVGSEFPKLDQTGMSLVEPSMEESDRKRAKSKRIEAEKMRPVIDHIPTGSEIDFTAGLKAIEEHEYQEAVRKFSLVLQEIPDESKHKNLWQVTDWTADKRLYSAFTLQQRAYAHCN